MRKIISNMVKRAAIRKSRQNNLISYSQSGEDLIIDYVLRNHFGVNNPSYLDIGAYDPVVFSNTYLFYERGSSGVLVEPDPDLAEKIAQKRPRDIVVNTGVADTVSKKDFFLVSPPTLNTFSKKELDQYKLFYPGTTLRKKINIQTTTPNLLMEQYFNNGLDLLSVDVEGFDYALITSLDLTKYRPGVICIETVEYQKGNTWMKTKQLASHLFESSYFLYADTFINSIFIDSERWKFNKQPNLKNFIGR